MDWRKIFPLEDEENLGKFRQSLALNGCRDSREPADDVSAGSTADLCVLDMPATPFESSVPRGEDGCAQKGELVVVIVSRHC